MQTQKVRWAILGAGKIARKFAHDLKAAVQHAELVAVASRDKERAREFAIIYGIPHVFDYQELYNSDQVDAVYIATPHNFHYEQSMACMQHGKAVLCEKPVTINDREFKKLATVSREKQVFLMEAMWTYFLPAIQKAKEWIDKGRIGQIKLIKADFGFRMEFDPEGRLYNPLLAGGALLDLGIYPVAFACFFMDRKPDAIMASGILGPTKVDENTAMVFHYGDALAVLSTSMVTTSNKGYIFGENGFIEIPNFYKAHTANLYNSQHELIESFTEERSTFGYEFEIQEATNCILRGVRESKTISHTKSNDIQEILTEVRKQINLIYPMEM